MFIQVLITEQRYKFESNSQHPKTAPLANAWCLLQSKDTNLKAIHNIRFNGLRNRQVLITEQRYKFESNSQLAPTRNHSGNWCLLQSKDTNLKAIHNIRAIGWRD